MQLINIFPLGNICMEYQQDMHMYLTHMVEKYSLYAEVARNAPGYKILDNSVIELGGTVSIERLVGAAEHIEADEIILPDAFQDGPATLTLVSSALQYLNKRWPNRDWPFKLMAVAQGKDIEEWYDCYQALLAMPDIDVIGIPKVLAKMHPQGRPYFVNELCNLYKVDKEHHLLGVWYSMSELCEYRKPNLIRSCDTVLMGFMAKYGMFTGGVRPDGFTVDLEKDVIDYSQINGSPSFDAINVGFSKSKKCCGGIK